MASQKGHHDVVQTLLGAGADVNRAVSVSMCIIALSIFCQSSIFTEQNLIKVTLYLGKQYHIIIKINIFVKRMFPPPTHTI